MTAQAFKILISDKLSLKGVEVFERAGAQFTVTNEPGLPREKLLEIIGDYDGLAIRSATKVDAEVLAKATRLKVVGRAGIGVDNVDLKAATTSGVLVMNTPGGNTVTTAEHAISLMCTLARRIGLADAAMKQGRWEKSKHQGRELTGKTFGVLGLGNIGRIVATRGIGLKMNVIASDPFVSQERARELGVELVSLDELIKRSDFLTVHVPLTDGTKNILDANRIQQMKKGAYLINAARGGLVDEQAVADALASGHLGGAAFDVFATEPMPADNPLLNAENVVLTPHLGASTLEAQVNVAVDVANQMVAYLRDGVILNAVNAPSVAVDRVQDVEPVANLGHRMARILAQPPATQLDAVNLDFAGNLSDLPREMVTAQVLAGLLQDTEDNNLNWVNASVRAGERGIKVTETASETCKNFAGTLRLTIRAGKTETTILGALFDRAPRIVEFDGLALEFCPAGTWLVTEHTDQPGMIGKLGSVLGGQGVNITDMTLGRAGAQARAFLNIAADADDAVLEALNDIDGVSRVARVRLDALA